MRIESHSILETYREAHDLASLGYHLVPVEYGGKRPLIAWKGGESSHRAIDEWFDRFRYQLNLAIHTGKSGIVGLDADTEEAAAWIGKHCPPTPMFASTPRGGLHAYFRATKETPPPAQNLFGIGLDVRSQTSLLIACPSWSREHRRRWVWKGFVLSPSQLPELPASLIRREPPRPLPRAAGHVNHAGSGPIRDVTRWIMGVESIEGAGGSNQCFKVACRLVDAGLGWDEAWRWLCRWNRSGQAIPPWSEAELSHKLRDAFARE